MCRGSITEVRNVFQSRSQKVTDKSWDIRKSSVLSETSTTY